MPDLAEQLPSPQPPQKRPFLSKHAADAVAKLRASNDITELEQLRAVQEAIDAATAPHAEEVKAHRDLVNDTTDKATADGAAAKKVLSDKENELIGARARIAELEGENTHLSQIINEQEAALLSLRRQTQAKDSTIADLARDLESAKAALAAMTAERDKNARWRNEATEALNAVTAERDALKADAAALNAARAQPVTAAEAANV